MQKITPFLWFDGNAQEAMKFYTSVFKNSRIINMNPMTGTFEINGQQFMVLNGGPLYKFNEAVSFFINCEGQEEVDELWEKLIEGGGQPGRCGWLKDKFGLSWQVIPSDLGRLLGGADREGAGRAMQAMMKMNKIEASVLQQAYDGK